MDMNIRRFLLVLVSALAFEPCIASNWFTGETDFRRATFQKGVLTDYNFQEGVDVVNLTETGIAPRDKLRPIISLDLANLNNRAYKKYDVYQYDETGAVQKAGSVSEPVWGVVWGYRDSLNFHALLLRGGNSDPYEYSNPELQYRILTVANGDTLSHTAWSSLSSSYINPGTDYNRIHIVPVTDGYEIYLGTQRECRIGLCRDNRLFGSLAGVYVGSGAQIRLKNWSVSACEYHEPSVLWTPDELTEHFKKSTNSKEGYYELLQASSSNSNIRLGGNYRLALVADQENLLLIYIDGAQRFPNQWQPGMVKAILQPTAHPNLFNVTWFDAEHKPLKEGVTALFLSNEILSIRFVNETVRLDWNRSYSPEENAQERDSFHPA